MSERYPFSIVWTPIPLITWLLPFIGHMGICNSEGVVHDFAGPYFVSVDNMAFGKPTKRWKLSLRDYGDPERYDQAIEETRKEYTHMMYSFFCNNCHSMVARALNQMQFRGKSNWTMVSVCIYFTILNRPINFKKALLSYLPSLVIAGIIALIVCL